MYKQNNEFTNVDYILYELMHTTKSTTKLMERIAKMTLNVDLIKQSQYTVNEKFFLKRQTLLFFSSVYQPIIYSESLINFCNISHDQQRLLSSGSLTIGRVFSNQEIDKKNITIETIQSKAVMGKLACKSQEIYCKEYEMFVDKINIGIIKEYFSKETIQRAIC
ncbi:chorismate pyruvate-lyase family protein [Sphingobacterium faecium]|uniref:chorismate pyruvate-lyase family protein n=1 Tax=Sphingobacterium faecium TaxID=34087 RepID=UPI00320BA5D0